MVERVSVGEAMAQALDRAEQVRQSYDRRPRVRLLTQFGDYAGGVSVVARISARTGAELEAQSGLGVRHIPFADLDRRAAELPDLVEEAAAEVVAAVAAAPPPGPRPSSAEDLHVEAFEATGVAAAKGLFDVVDRLVKGAPAALGKAAAAEACMGAALRLVALTAIPAGVELPDLEDSLRFEVTDLRRATEAYRPPGASSH